MKKYFEIKEAIMAGTQDPVRNIILYHPFITGYLLYSPLRNQILKCNLWETSIDPDDFREIIRTIKKEMPESILIESSHILMFPNAEMRLPGIVYNPDEIKSWMELSYGKDSDMVYMTEKKNNGELIFVSAMNQLNRDLLLSEFNQSTFHSLSTSFFNNYSGENHDIQIIFYGRDIYVALYHRDKLQILNSFTFHTPEDVLYVLLNLCDQYLIDKDRLTIYPEGFIDPEASVMKLLEQYFLHIQWPVNISDRKYSMPEDISIQTGQFLERIISCVS